MKSKSEENCRNLKLRKAIALIQLMESRSTPLLASLAGLIPPEVGELLASNAIRAKKAEALQATINAQLAESILFKPEEFPEVKLRDSTKKLFAETPNPEPGACAELNAAFLSEALPTHFRPMRAARKKIKIATGCYRIEGVAGIFASVKIKAKSYSTSLKTNDRSEAVQKRAEWVQKLTSTEAASACLKGSLADYFEKYLETRQLDAVRGSVKPQRTEDLRRDFQRLLAHCPHLKALDVSQFDKAGAAAVAKHLLCTAKSRAIRAPGRTPTGLKPATYTAYIIPLVMLWKHLRNQGIVNAERYLEVKEQLSYARSTPRMIIIPTPKQLLQMRLRLYQVRQGPSFGEVGVKFDFLMLTGARIATVNAAKVMHYNPVTRRILLTHLKARAGQLTEKEIPVCAELAEILDRYIAARHLNPQDLLFQTKNNNRALATAARGVGIGTWFHHACRKWFGTTVMNLTKDPVTTSEMMCHNDGGTTLLKAYRQVCSEHHDSFMRGLKLYPGAYGINDLELIQREAHKAVDQIGLLDPAAAKLGFDRIFYVAERLRVNDFAAVKMIPALGSEPPTSYQPVNSRSTVRPSPTQIRQNVRFLVESRCLKASDLSIGTQLSISTVARLLRTGDLQAAALPKIATFFGVTNEALLCSDLRADSNSHTTPQTGAAVAPVLATVPILAPIDSLVAASDDPPQLTGVWESVDSHLEILVGLPDAELRAIIARNLKSLLLERGLTPNGLNILLSSKVAYDYLTERFVPSNESLFRMCQILKVQVREFLDPKRDNVVPIPSIVAANLQTFAKHHGLADSTYAVRRGLDARVLAEVIETGDISAAQAHKLAKAEGVLVRQLVMEDLAKQFPPKTNIVVEVIARNISSLCWETGLSASEIALRAGVNAGTGINYQHGRVKRILPKVLEEIARSLNLTVAEIADPARPTVTFTPQFHANLSFVFDPVATSLTKFSNESGIQPRRLRALLDGASPEPHHVAKLCKMLNLTPRQLLMEPLNPVNRPPENAEQHIAP